MLVMLFIRPNDSSSHGAPLAGPYTRDETHTTSRRRETRTCVTQHAREQRPVCASHWTGASALITSGTDGASALADMRRRDDEMVDVYMMTNLTL